MSVSLNVILDTRRIKKSNKYPVKLRATFERIADDHQTIFDLSKEDFEKLDVSRINGALQSIRDKLRDIKRTAQNAAVKLDPFTFEDFERDYIRNNIYFRQRKTKPISASGRSDEFNYEPFYFEPTIFENMKKVDNSIVLKKKIAVANSAFNKK